MIMLSLPSAAPLPETTHLVSKPIPVWATGAPAPEQTYVNERPLSERPGNGHSTIGTVPGFAVGDVCDLIKADSAFQFERGPLDLTKGRSVYSSEPYGGTVFKDDKMFRFILLDDDRRMLSYTLSVTDPQTIKSSFQTTLARAVAACGKPTYVRTVKRGDQRYPVPTAVQFNETVSEPYGSSYVVGWLFGDSKRGTNANTFYRRVSQADSVLPSGPGFMIEISVSAAYVSYSSVTASQGKYEPASVEIQMSTLAGIKIR